MSLELHKYEFHYAKIILKNGKEYIAYVGAFFPAYGNEPPEDSIGIKANEFSTDGLEITESEIESMELIK